MRKKDIHSQRSIFLANIHYLMNQNCLIGQRFSRSKIRKIYKTELKKVNSLIIFTSTRLHFYAVIGNNYLREVTPVHLATLSRGSPVSW